MGRVEALAADVEAVHLDKAAGDPVEHLRGTVVLEESHPEVVQGLLADVGVIGLYAERVLPEEVELESFEDLLVGEVIPLLEHVQAHEQANRLVGAAVAFVEAVAEDLLVDDGEDSVAKDLGP